MRILADSGSTPFVIVARPGTMGSSGDHKHKYWASESRVMGEAIDQLEAKFGFSRIVLAGHSGGALLTANLLSKRKDVVCAVMASGAVSISHYAADYKMDRNVSSLWEDPADNIAEIADLRQPLIVLTGTGDPRRPERYQEEYAAKLAARGLDVHYWVLSMRGDPHDTQREAVLAAKDCAAGITPEAIRKRFKIKSHQD